MDRVYAAGGDGNKAMGHTGKHGAKDFLFLAMWRMTHDVLYSCKRLRCSIKADVATLDPQSTVAATTRNSPMEIMTLWPEIHKSVTYYLQISLIE